MSESAQGARSGADAAASGASASDGAGMRALSALAPRTLELFAILPAGVALIDIEPPARYVIAAVNPAFERNFGVRAAALAGREVEQALLPGLAAALLKGCRRCSESSATAHVEDSLPTPAGPRPFEVSTIPVPDGAGPVPRLIVLLRDTAKRTEAARSLAAREREFRTLAENTHDYIVRWDRALRRLYVNPAFAKAVGVPAQTLIGTPIGAGFEPPRREASSAAFPVLDRGVTALLVERIGSVFRSGEPASVEMSVPSAKGSRFAHVTLVAERDESGDVVSVLGIGRDVTDLKQREHDFRTLAENTPDSIVRLDRELRRAYVNPAFARSVGVPAADLIGTPLGTRPEAAGSAGEPGASTIFDAQAIALLKQRAREVFDDGQTQTIELTVRAATGLRHSQVSLVAERNDEGEIGSVLAIGRNVTELKRREHDFRLLADNSPDLIGRFDRGGRCLFVNAAVERLAALPMTSLIGRNVQDMGFGRRGPLLRATGAALRDALARVAADGRTLNLELRLAGTGGVHTYQISVVPERDQGEQVTSVLAVGRDITAHKKAEAAVRQLNLQLEQRVAERTAALAAANRELETFAYSVSHDLKAPLRWIDGYSRLLLENCRAALDDEGRLFIDNVRRATLQMNELIDDLLSYSRIERQRMQPATIALDRLVQGAMEEWVDELHQRGVDLRLSVPQLTVLADRAALTVVLRNLIGNALKFSAAATPPVLEIGAREEGAQVLLWVRDNGIGFDMKFHERIFEIFQRLQRAEDYPGTGIGLALVRRAVGRIGGRVWADSAPGRGATFFVRLPR